METKLTKIADALERLVAIFEKPTGDPRDFFETDDGKLHYDKGSYARRERRKKQLEHWRKNRRRATSPIMQLVKNERRRKRKLKKLHTSDSENLGETSSERCARREDSDYVPPDER